MLFAKALIGFLFVNGKLMGILANGLFNGRTLDHQAKLDVKIRALKREDVVNALRKHIDPNKLVNVVAGDLKAAEAK